jgi:general secretion pathway protein L
VPTVSLLLKQEGTPDNGLFLDMGERRSTMVLFLKRRVALIRSFSINAPIFGSTPKGDHAETPTREQAESWFESFCTMVENTIHSLGCQSNREVQPETVFFTGVGALYADTADLLTRFLGIPAQEIDLRKHRKINIGESVARMWNPVLMDNALALSLRNGKQGQGFNFRKDEFEIKKRGFWLQKEFQRAMIFLGVILCLLIVDMGVDYYFLKERYKMLDQRVTEVFSRTFPDVKRIVDPLQQMRVKVNEVKTSAVSIPGTDSSNKVLDLLKDISDRIPKSLDVHVTRMVIDQETVRVSGKTDTFNTVDGIKNGLEPSKYFSGVTISSANLDRTGKRVQFEIKLQRKK